MPLRVPRFGFDNLITDLSGTLTADSEADGYNVENLQDWKPYTFWKPAATGDHNAKIVFSTPRPVNYFCLYAQDLWKHGGTIALESSDDGGSTWVSRTGTITPVDSKPLYISFPQFIAAQWRVRVVSTPASAIGVVSFGVDMQLQYGAWKGFSPPIFNRNTVVTNQTSETAQPLARSINQAGNKLVLPLDFHTELWVRQNWIPFMKHAELKNWFFQWNPLDYPFDVAFCRTDKRPGAPAFSVFDMMKMDLSADAWVD